MSGTGVADLARDLEAQRSFFEQRVPGYARVLAELSSHLGALAPMLGAAWHGRRFESSYERPLLLLAALRYDATAEGPTHPLHAALVEEASRPEVVTAEALTSALAPERRRVHRALAERFVQTNETSRAVAWMWVAHLIETADPGRPCALADLGASAGLNLVADALPALWVDQHGRAIPTHPLPPIVLRLGVDLHPLDAREADARAWLRACVWPGDTARLARLEAAFAALDVAGGDRSMTLVECDLGDAPARLAAIDGAVRVVATQMIVRDYVPPPVRRRYLADMRAWLADRPPCGAVWVELEPGGSEEPDRLVALAVHVRARQGDVRTFELARTQPHPRRLFVDGVATAAFVREVRESAVNAD